MLPEYSQPRAGITFQTCLVPTHPYLLCTGLQWLYEVGRQLFDAVCNGHRVDASGKHVHGSIPVPAQVGDGPLLSCLGSVLQQLPLCSQLDHALFVLLQTNNRWLNRELNTYRVKSVPHQIALQPRLPRLCLGD